MKYFFLLLLWALWYPWVIYALPIPALAFGYDFILMLIPLVISGFSIVCFWLRRYTLAIGGWLSLFGGILWVIHVQMTQSYLFFLGEEYTYIGLTFIWILFARKISFLRYLLVFWGLMTVFCIGFLDIKRAWDLHLINQFHQQYGKDKSISYKLKDNFFVIYDAVSGKDLIVVSDCYEGEIRTGWVVLSGYQKDSSKSPLENGKCLYTASGDRRYIEIMRGIIQDE